MLIDNLIPLRYNMWYLRRGGDRMDIHGLQKLTLLDFPGHVACTVFLAGCDFRCPFCHNGGLVLGGMEPVMDDAGLLEFLRKRQGLLDGVAVTGGEPLLRPDLPLLLRAVKDLGYAVKLDTNGSHPTALRSLVEEGLVDYVAMDIKNSPEKYGGTVGLPFFDLNPIQESVTYLLSGAVNYEFRTTAVAEFHDDASFEGIARWIAGAKRYYIQCFTDRDSVIRSGLHAPDKVQLERWADIVRPLVPSVELRGV